MYTTFVNISLMKTSKIIGTSFAGTIVDRYKKVLRLLRIGLIAVFTHQHQY
jgi:hypothetical protein